MTIRMLQLQVEVGNWLTRNFGKVAVEDQVLIIAEEVGELAHSVLKRKQGIRRNEDHETKIRDAVADIVIATAAFCSVEGINLEETVAEVWAKVSTRDWTAERNAATA